MAVRQKRYLAQLHWYTQYELELNPNWKPSNQ